MRVIRLSLGLCAGALFAQHGYSPAEVDAGGRLYRSNCVNCHGQEGTAIQGVDLGRGKFRRASTDDDLARIIINGIPGSPMPPSNFTQAQADTIVAYLRSRVGATTATASAGGDAVRGKAVFEGKGGCRMCHRVNGNGSRVGPDLSEIGALRSPENLQESIVNPNAEIRPENRTVRAVTRDGATVTGRVLTEDTFGVQIIDSHEKLVSLSKANLREYGFLKDSPMRFLNLNLSAQDVADLVSYLQTLKGVDAQ
ncbi:MAG TPA: c-type cytochrome [Bryobacteraceae bacterium]|jgi:putative heme-binding domain-containing protein|nr:c-type cytochrome [Bryobacteraceae bacterium]